MAALASSRQKIAKRQAAAAAARAAARAAEHAFPSIRSISGLNENEQLSLIQRLRTKMSNGPFDLVGEYLLGNQNTKSHPTYTKTVQNAVAYQKMANSVIQTVNEYQCNEDMIKLLDQHGRRIEDRKPYLMYLLHPSLYDINATVLYGEIDPSPSKHSFKKVPLETMKNNDYILLSIDTHSIIYIPKLIDIVLNQSRQSYSYSEDEEFIIEPSMIEPYATISYGDIHKQYYHVKGLIILIQVVKDYTFGERATQFCSEIGHRFGLHTPNPWQPPYAPRYMIHNGSFDPPAFNGRPKTKRQKTGGKQTKKQKVKKLKKRSKKIKKQKQSTRKRKVK